jgi:hypothetical protein
MVHYENLFETKPELEMDAGHPDKPIGTDDQGWRGEVS